MINWTRDICIRFDERYPAHARVFRFLFSGGTALCADLVLLYLLTSVLGIWYLASAIVAFVLSVGVNFGLQKFWTFGDRSRAGLPAQIGAYLLLVVANLALNTLIVYALVERAGLRYLVAQIASSVLIAIGNFFAYQRFIFQK